MADAAAGQGRISLPMASQVQAGTITDRPLTQAEFEREYLYDPPPLEGAGRQLLDLLRRQCPPSTSCVVGVVARHVPILSWLPRYDVRSDLVGDIISGVTVAIMHIPQGMAYALLAGIPPIHGIYMGFLQCLLYACFGTSRHLSVGTFAVTCIMTGKVVAEHSRQVQLDAAGDDCGHQAAGCVAGGQPTYDAVQVATTLALAVGLVQLAMFVLRAGALTVILSDMLVRGFTTGAAVHVLCSQLQSLLGLSLPTHSGIGKLVKLVVAVIRNIQSVNAVSIVISVATTIILVLNNEIIKPRLALRTRCPVPIELLVVIAGTALSFCTDLAGNHGVAVIGTITTGLPPPSSAVLSLLPDLLLDATIIAIITYSIAISMAQLLASKHKYSVDANQELLAQGIGNVVSAWFSSAPMGASLSRSLIADSTGGRTQAAGIITALLLLIVLLWLGPVFQTLPKCVLSSIIVVSLKGLLRQVKDVVPLWRTSRADALIWAATFVAAVAADIDVGLAVGVATSLAVLMWRHQWPPAELLAPARAVGLYLNPEKYGAVESDHDIRIFRFGGALHFCNTRHFRRSLFGLTGLNPERWQPTETRRRTRHRQRTGKSHLRAELVPLTEESGGSDSDKAPQSPAESSTVQISEDIHISTGDRSSRTCAHPTFSHLVFDMSRVTFTDTASTRDLLKLLSQYRTIGVSCYLADCNETVLGLVEACGGGLAEHQLYPSLHDAVLAIRSGGGDSSARLTSESAS